MAQRVEPSTISTIRGVPICHTELDDIRDLLLAYQEQRRALEAASPVVPVGVSREEIAKTLFERHWSAVSASPKWPGDDDGSYWLWLADAILAALRPTERAESKA
jgi:hypothetical protein